MCIRDSGWKYGTHTRRLFTFALDGPNVMPARIPPTYAKPVDPAGFEINEDLASYGQQKYAESCSLCHGGGAVSGGGAPDLRESPLAMSLEALSSVLIDGAIQSRGMPRFPTYGEREVEGLLHYVRKMARETVGKPINTMHQVSAN